MTIALTVSFQGVVPSSALRRQMAEHIRMRRAAVKTPVPRQPAASGE